MNTISNSHPWRIKRRCISYTIYSHWRTYLMSLMRFRNCEQNIKAIFDNIEWIKFGKTHTIETSTSYTMKATYICVEITLIDVQSKFVIHRYITSQFMFTRWRSSGQMPRLFVLCLYITICKQKLLRYQWHAQWTQIQINVKTMEKNI